MVLLKCKSRSYHSSQHSHSRASYLILAKVPTVASVGPTTSEPPPPKSQFSSPCSHSSSHTDLNVISWAYLTYFYPRAFAFAAPFTRQPHGIFPGLFQVFAQMSLSHWILSWSCSTQLQDPSSVSIPFLLYFFSLHLSPFDILDVLLISS